MGGTRIFLGLRATAVSIAPDAPGTALVLIGILCLPVAIVLLTAFIATVLAPERPGRHRHYGDGPDGDAGPG